MAPPVIAGGMSPLPDPKSVSLEGQYYHVRFRDPGEFEEIDTPEWARRTATSISAASQVRMGRRAGSDDWEVQSVLIAANVGESKARIQGERIVEEIEG